MERPYYQLMLITQKENRTPQDYLQFIRRCAIAGITSVQLREKHMPYSALLEWGQEIKAILAPYHIPLIVNDHIDLALALDAEGIHLGQTDGDPILAREKLGTEKIIGVSINTLSELHEANTLPVNYVGVGAIFQSKNKTDVKTIWGIDGLKHLAPLAKHPIVAIGGINHTNASTVIQAGAKGIAVIQALHQTVTVEECIQTLLDATGEVTC